MSFRAAEKQNKATVCRRTLIEPYFERVHAGGEGGMVFFHGGGRAGREAQRRRVRPLAAVAHHPPLRHEALQLAQPDRVADHADRAAVVRGGALLAPATGGLVGQVVAEVGAAAVLALLVRDDRREQRLQVRHLLASSHCRSGAEAASRVFKS